MDTIETCKKKKHLSKSEAIFFQKRSNSGFFRTYLCPHCDYWHVSTMPLNVRAHLDILNFIKRKYFCAKKIGYTTPLIDVYEVEYRECKYLVLYYNKERTIRILEETI